MQKIFHLSKKEVEHCNACGNHTGKDNILFFGDNTNEVFLLLHGGVDGLVEFNHHCLTLEQVYHNLKKEDVFTLLLNLNIKHIYVLCCHSLYQDSYEEDGIIIETYFNNKGCLLGKDFLFKNEFYYGFIEEEDLIA